MVDCVSGRNQIGIEMRMMTGIFYMAMFVHSQLMTARLMMTMAAMYNSIAVRIDMRMHRRQRR